MNTDLLPNPDDRQRSRLILWFDDDPEMLPRMEHLFMRREHRIRVHPFSDFEEFRMNGGKMEMLAHDSPFVALIITRAMPDSNRLREVFDRILIRGVISDLEIAGDALAGLSILTAAASSRSRPELAVFSSNEDESVRRLAKSIGVRAFLSKRDDAGISRLLDEWLDLRGYETSRRVHHLTQEMEELRRQNQRLQREKRALKKELESVNEKNRSPGKQKAVAQVDPAQKGDVQRAQHLAQMVMSHNHDLSNTSSLTLKTLEHLCTDPNLVPPVLLTELQRARIAAKHCDILVQSLASISGNEKIKRSETSSLESAVKDACEVLARKIPNGITLQTQIPQRLPLCAVPGHLLVRIILNLVLNAIEAMPRGGTLAITAQPPRRGDKKIRLQVQDSGIGIKASDLPKVCRHDFSTKGKRHGFGLFIIKEIVNEFKGELKLDSKRGRGTTVNLKLPSI